MRNTNATKNDLDMKLEAEDNLKASTITFNFICLKASNTPVSHETPRRFYLQIRFFTFPEIQTDVVQLVAPGQNKNELVIKAGHDYFLSKE